MGKNPSWFSRTVGGSDAVKDIPDADLKRFPVENVSWENCQLLIAKLKQVKPANKSTGSSQIKREQIQGAGVNGTPACDA